METLSFQPVEDPLAQHNLIQQIIAADISDPLLLADIITRRPELGFLYVVPRKVEKFLNKSMFSNKKNPILLNKDVNFTSIVSELNGVVCIIVFGRCGWSLLIRSNQIR